MTQKQFEVKIEDKPGEIARIADILAKSDVNIKGVATEKGSDGPTLRIVADDDANARKALKLAKVQYKERDVTIVTLPYKPGELAKATKKLAENGLNVESLYVLGSPKKGVDQVVIAVDDQSKAEKLFSAS